MLSARSLLELWEAGQGRTSLERGLLLFGLAAPSAPADALLESSLGARNAALLRMRQGWIGDAIESEIACGACGEPAEVRFSIAGLLATPSASAGAALTLREMAELGTLPREEALARLASRGLEEGADPLAVIAIETVCPACSAPGRHLFDPARFLWEEVEIRAVRLMRDVHRLARAYAWTEATILDLGPRRRQVYLQMAGAG